MLPRLGEKSLSVFTDDPSLLLHLPPGQAQRQRSAGYDVRIKERTQKIKVSEKIEQKLARSV